MPTREVFRDAPTTPCFEGNKVASSSLDNFTNFIWKCFKYFLAFFDLRISQSCFSVYFSIRQVRTFLQKQFYYFSQSNKQNFSLWFLFKFSFHTIFNLKSKLLTSPFVLNIYYLFFFEKTVQTTTERFHSTKFTELLVNDIFFRFNLARLRFFLREKFPHRLSDFSLV